VTRTAVLSSTMTTSPMATGTPLIVTCMSAPADCRSRITLLRFQCKHSRTDTVAVPSSTSIWQTTSLSGSRAALMAVLLDNEFDEEDINHLQLVHGV
jgi:hypothetical protein